MRMELTCDWLGGKYFTLNWHVPCFTFISSSNQASGHGLSECPMIGGPEPLRTVLGPAGPCGVLFLRRNDFRIDFNMPLPLVPNPAEPEYPESVGPPSSREFNNDIYNRERIRIVCFSELETNNYGF